MFVDKGGFRGMDIRVSGWKGDFFGEEREVDLWRFLGSDGWEGWNVFSGDRGASGSM